MNIGYRTIKTAVGAALAVFISQALGLQFYVSAAIITILCLKATRKASLKDSIIRFSACISGLLFGMLMFFLFGYSPAVIALIFLLLIPLLVKFKIQEGFVTSAVVLMHIYTNKQVNFNFFLNELQLIVIGIGVSLILNLAYMPNMERMIIDYRDSLERNFSLILKEMVYYLRYGESNWTGKEMLETVEIIKKAKHLSLMNEENRLLRDTEDPYFYYFEMREKQFELLERMLPLVSSLPKYVSQVEQVAIFLEKLSNHVHPGNTAHLFLDKLNELKSEFKNQPLPQSREEFETRAALFQLMNEIERYLFIKQDYNKNKTEN